MRAVARSFKQTRIAFVPARNATRISQLSHDAIMPKKPGWTRRRVATKAATGVPVKTGVAHKRHESSSNGVATEIDAFGGGCLGNLQALQKLSRSEISEHPVLSLEAPAGHGMREHGPTYPFSIKVKSSAGLSDIIALNSPAKPITSPAFEPHGTKDIFACVKLPSGYNAGDLIKGVGRTGPNRSCVSRVKLVVLCRMPGPTYWMAAADGIVMLKENGDPEKPVMRIRTTSPSVIAIMVVNATCIVAGKTQPWANHTEHLRFHEMSPLQQWS
jgi:hypothetical protein